MKLASFLLRLALVLAAVALAMLGARAVSPPPAAAHYAFGTGPAIVLVHGLGSSSAHWLRTARILARRHRVELVDLPGHGDSAMPDPFSLEQAEASLDRALASIAGGPVVLVGHSLGGLIAAAEAIDHPSRVRALVLVEAPLKQDLDPNERAQLLAALDGDYRGVVRDAYESFGRDSAQGAALWAEVSALDPSLIKPWIRLALSTDLSSRAAAIGAPVLAVMAARSWANDQPWSAARDAMGYRAIANLTPIRLEGCGHFVMLDRPEALATAIERFADARTNGAIAVR
ncbi:MAG: alpha/beta fold hydrolase [Candidatus Eisenbacteria bacterium]|nr:alpha/beta fold hydrolase [Candidatus Eisenbacteria bacterium]